MFKSGLRVVDAILEAEYKSIREISFVTVQSIIAVWSNVEVSLVSQFPHLNRKEIQKRIEFYRSKTFQLNGI